MTTTQNQELPALHKTWWKAPLVVSVLGLPILGVEFGLIQANDGMDQYGFVIYTALVLFALTWLLPHRRSLRTFRIVMASLALGWVLLPLLWALLLGLAMSS
ncbi:hypothetical protein ACFYVL_01515 [Streptomyces sp. NPDC004111]|uniref:hypothetical protein n=1 Tax=Streptomyces sp. NPDC004111 TaxID=3364690 RepID=UPI00368DB9E4